MQDNELVEFFGAKALIQFREAVMLTTSGGKTSPYVPFTEAGQPNWVPVGTQAPGAVRPGMSSQLSVEMSEAPEFTLTVLGTIMPGQGGRVFVMYESRDGYLMRISVRPGDILAATLAVQKADKKSELIAPGS